MGYHKKQDDVGVGFCDFCYDRIFGDEEKFYYEEKKVLVCSSCVKEALEPYFKEMGMNL